MDWDPVGVTAMDAVVEGIKEGMHLWQKHAHLLDKKRII